MKQPFKVRISPPRFLIQIQEPILRRCRHRVQFMNVLPHALFLLEGLLLPLIFQIEGNDGRGIDTNRSLNGGVRLGSKDETHFMMSSHEG